MFFSFFYTVHWSFILGQGWLLSNNFCKACQNCLRPSFVIAVRMHELLLCWIWKLPQLPSCSANNGNLFVISFFDFEKFGVKHVFCVCVFLYLTLFIRIGHRIGHQVFTTRSVKHSYNCNYLTWPLRKQAVYISKQPEDLQLSVLSEGLRRDYS